MDVRRMDGMWVVVTGAGSGIGRETALLCAQRGARVALCDLDKEGLEETGDRARELGAEPLWAVVDVADAEALDAFADRVHRETTAVDLLVNNAGVGLVGGFLDTRRSDWDWILDINVKGVVHGCQAFLPAMLARGTGGHVVNLASAAAFLPSATLSAYGATKAAVLALSESLAVELSPHGIGVSAICPGIVDTAITRSAPIRGEADAEATRERLVSAYARRGYRPERVAEAILEAVQSNRCVAPVTIEARAIRWLKRLSPGALRAIARRSVDGGPESR